MSCEGEHLNSYSNNNNGHSHLHGDELHSHFAPIPTFESQSLLPVIDCGSIQALNVSNPALEIGSLFRPAADRALILPAVLSDCDSQIILHIPFSNALVKLFSMIIRSNGQSFCPKTIKIYKNDPTIDFDNVISKNPALVLTHPHVGVMYDDLHNEATPKLIESPETFIEHFLPRHMFTGLQHVTLFIQDTYLDNEGEDRNMLRLHYIEMRGEFMPLSKNPVISVYELAANPADHKTQMVTDAMRMQFSS